VPLRAATSYGQQGAFTSVACRGSDVVALSSASGGVHANPRVSVWRGASHADAAAPAAGGAPAAAGASGDGWYEVPVPFELFGGPLAGSVGRVVAGPAGWLIVGHRVSRTTGRPGAAVWLSADGEGFHLVDDAPALRSTDDAVTTAYDAAPRPDGGWLLVGSSGQPTRPRPAAWTSADGLHWARTHVERSEVGAVERAVPLHDRLLAVGGEGGAVRSWRVDPARKGLNGDAVIGRFGAEAEVSALRTVSTAAGSIVVAAVGAGLFGITDGTGADWLPIRPPAGTGDGDRLRLAGRAPRCSSPWCPRPMGKAALPRSGARTGRDGRVAAEADGKTVTRWNAERYCAQVAIRETAPGGAASSQERKPVTVVAGMAISIVLRWATQHSTTHPSGSTSRSGPSGDRRLATARP